MEELISLNDFVTKYVETGCAIVQIRKIGNYAEFLKQPLKLEMFVPCDEDSNVLEEPIETIGGVEFYYKKYNKAKEKVLFEGFEFDDISCLDYFENKKLVNNNVLEILKEIGVKTIEDLIPYNLTLTKNATNNEL